VQVVYDLKMIIAFLNLNLPEVGSLSRRRRERRFIIREVGSSVGECGKCVIDLRPSG
jgi:hypothetical protein